MFKVIKSSSQKLTVPQPFNKFYSIISDAEVAEKYDGYEYDSYPCEDVEGYDGIHLAWVAARPKYEDKLADCGLDIIELISLDGATFLGYVAGNRLYSLDKSDIVAAGLDF